MPRQAILTNTPTPLGAQMLVACTALHAYRNGLTVSDKQCCESWDPVAICFDRHGVECRSFNIPKGWAETMLAFLQRSPL